MSTSTMATFTVAAVQAGYVLMDRDATIDRVAELTAAAARRAPSSSCSPRCSSRDADLDRHPADLGRRRASGSRCWPTRRWSSPARPPTGSAPSAREAGVVGWSSGSRSGSRRVDDLQHAAVLRPDGRAPRQAPQADAHRLGAHGLGHGRRLDAARGRHAARPDRRADLLGELHAAGPVPPLRARRRRVAGADARPGRRLDRDHAAPGAREPDVRRRRQPGPARRPDPGGLPGPRPLVPESFVDDGPLDRARQHRDRGPERRHPRRAGPRTRGDAHRRARPAQGRRPRRLMDPTGHYNRPDIFQLLVDTTARRPVVTTDRGHVVDLPGASPSAAAPDADAPHRRHVPGVGAAAAAHDVQPGQRRRERGLVQAEGCGVALVELLRGVELGVAERRRR